jgi:hypothetical protein
MRVARRAPARRAERAVPAVNLQLAADLATTHSMVGAAKKRGSGVGSGRRGLTGGLAKIVERGGACLIERSADRGSRTVWFDESGFNTRNWLMHWGYALKGDRFETVGQGSWIDRLTSFDSYHVDSSKILAARKR